MDKKVVIFARVSTSNQEYDRQVNELTVLAANNNWKVCACFTEKISGAKANTALAVHTPALVSKHTFLFLVEAMYPVGALLFADAAARAPLVAPDDLKRRVDVFDSH